MPSEPIDPDALCPDDRIGVSGYPTVAFLEWLERCGDNVAVMAAAIAYFDVCGYGGVQRLAANRVSLSTHGWSGCEDVIDALQGNRRFWHDCWEEHHRGGRWVFEVDGLRL